MGKIKVKRKSTLIDMTAMSDVTVLLLTFFMLTSTFLQKEPTQVITPPSVSETKVEISNVAQILVATDKDQKNTRVFINVIGEANPELPDVEYTQADAEKDPSITEFKGMWSSENLRKNIIRNAVKKYEDAVGQPNAVGLTPEDVRTFSKITTFGVPMQKLHEFLSLSQDAQDEWISNMERGDVGIPTTMFKAADGRETSQFQIWMEAIRDSGNPGLTEAMRKTGSGIAVKADRTTPFSMVNEVLESLRSIKLNKFTVMTALKTEND